MQGLKAVAGVSLVAAGLLSGCGVSGALKVGAMGQSDSANSGYYDEYDLLDPAGVKWRFKTQKPSYGAPVVVGETAYFGSDDGYLYAVYADSGKRKWRYRTRGKIDSRPAISGG
jgi:outer membrane protein assembly factor BamB